MAERTLAEALAHGQGDHGDCVPAVEPGFCEDDDVMAALLASEVLRLRAELEQAPERSRMAMLERIGLLKKAEK